MVNEGFAERAEPKRRALVAYDTKYGNTKKIAEALQLGLKDVGLETACLNAMGLAIESLKEFDLIAVDAPTEKMTASKSIKEFLEKLENANLSRKFGFAFDTRLPFPLSGSGAKFIEKELKNSGLEIIAPRASATVVSHKDDEGGIRLKEGEEKRFEQIGREVGTAFLARAEGIPA